MYFENDGIHEIIVKALNNAGLSTEAVAKVYIDTIAPSSASDFRVTTGPDQILVRWDRYPEEENLKAFISTASQAGLRQSTWRYMPMMLFWEKRIIMNT